MCIVDFPVYKTPGNATELRWNMRMGNNFLFRNGSSLPCRQIMSDNPCRRIDVLVQLQYGPTPELQGLVESRRRLSTMPGAATHVLSGLAAVAWEPLIES